VGTSFLKRRKSIRFPVKRLSLEWRDSSSSVAMRKDQVVYRSDARALIKLTSIFFANGSQGYLTDWGLLRAWEKRRWTGSIRWRMSENCMKEWSVRLSLEWAGCAGFCILLSPGGSGVDSTTVDFWVLGWWLGQDVVCTRLVWKLASSPDLTKHWRL